VFLAGFRLATARKVPLAAFWRAAAASAIAWQILLAAGTFLLAHQVRHAQQLYGVFGVVLGLLAWLHLQAQMTLLALEADVVRAHRLWPRSLMPPPLTSGDKRALRAYVQRSRRRPAAEQRIEVSFPPATATSEGERAADGPET
jgi:membrane protein